ncbi:MAG: T9SS type A sorting domain-containing protein [Melioribacteraceae bacterium]|nr:T9SS type A sorting domain-containing protein [Melioribacteraceae bacterium]
MVFHLTQNYPNPFNPTTSIEYQVSSSEKVSLKVYDILGREIKTLVNEVKSPGSYEVQFDAPQLASGVYFYRLTASDFVQTKKMILLR